MLILIVVGVAFVLVALTYFLGEWMAGPAMRCDLEQAGDSSSDE